MKCTLTLLRNHSVITSIAIICLFLFAVASAAEPLRETSDVFPPGLNRVDRETGTIEFLYCINYARCYSMRSTDEGLTWSDPVDITATFEPFRKHYDWKVNATGPGHRIQLTNGRLVVPIWVTT